MQSSVFFTIVAKNYYGFAKAWANSVAKVYPENPIYIFIVDELDGCIDRTNEPFPIIMCNEVDIPDFEYMKFIYEVTEMSTSVKPFCIEHLYKMHMGCPVIYMDSDTKVFSKFEEVETLLRERADVILTPHICEPLFDGKRPDEHIFIRAGIFNLGFGVFNSTPAARSFVGWWAEKLAQYCVWDLDAGIHVDQKWMDYAPAFLDKFRSLRHPGYNIAYWNYAHRKVSLDGDQWVVNGFPVRFVHVSGNKITDPNNFSAHQDRYKRSELGDFDRLLSEYQASVIGYGQLQSAQWSYSYQSGRYFVNIPFYIRKSFRSKFNRMSMRDTNVEEFAWNYFNEIDDSIPESRLSRMQTAFYNTRADLKLAFNLKESLGQKKFLDWLEESGIDLLTVPGNR